MPAREGHTLALALNPTHTLTLAPAHALADALADAFALAPAPPPAPAPILAHVLTHAHAHAHTHARARANAHVLTHSTAYESGQLGVWPPVGVHDVWVGELQRTSFVLRSHALLPLHPSLLSLIR